MKIGFYLNIKLPNKYLMTALIIAVTTGIQWLIWPFIDPAPFILYYPAIILASLYGDGLSAIVLSSLIAQYLFIPPIYSLSINGPSDLARQALFIASSLMIRQLTRSLSTALKRVEGEKRKAEESKEWFNQTLTCIGDAVIATDKEGRVQFMNSIAEELTEWPFNDAKGRPLVDVFNIINQDTRQLAENPVEKVMQTGIICGLANHTMLIGRHGKKSPIEDSAAPIRIMDGGPIIGVVLVFRDVRDKYHQARILKETNEQIKSSERRFKSVIDNALDAVVGMDDRGIITHWNMQAEKIFGHTSSEAIGQRMSNTIIPPSLREAHELGLRHYLATGEGPVLNKRIEITGIRKNGNEFPVELSITPIWENNNVFFAGFIRDISEQKKMGRELLLKSEALENSLNAFDIVNEKGEFIYVNSAYLMMWGYNDKDEVLGTSLANHCAEPVTSQKIIRSLKEGGECDLEFVARRKDGSTFDVRMWARLAHDSEGNEVYPATSIDITERKRAEEAIKVSEEQFRSLANSMSQLAWIADASGWIYWYNDQWYNYTGTTLEEMQGWGWQKVHHPDHIDKILTFVKEAWKIPRPFELTFPLKSKNGEWRWFLTRAVPIIGPHGQIIRWFGTNTDIQHQKDIEASLAKMSQEAQQNLKKLDSVVYNLNEGLIFADASGNLLSMNPAALRIHEFSTTDQMIKRLSDYPELFVIHTSEGQLLPVEDWPLSRVLRGERFSQYEVEVHRKDTGKTWIGSYGGTPILDENGKLMLAVLTVRDVTDKKNTELALKEAIRVRDEFLSIASHELKTPLTSLTLQGQIRKRQILKGQTEAFTADKLAKMVEGDLKQLNRVNRLIDDMLDISRLRMGSINLQKERVNLASLVLEVVERIRPQFIESSREITVKSAEEIFVQGDPFRLEQVFSNLLTNAMKYGSDMPVRVEVGINHSNEAFVSVIDQGIGITKEDQKRIFYRFERAVSANEVSGLGLGLAIAMDIVKAHGGRIHLESEFGKGSTFTVILPTEQQEKSK